MLLDIGEDVETHMKFIEIYSNTKMRSFFLFSFFISYIFSFFSSSFLDCWFMWIWIKLSEFISHFHFVYFSSNSHSQQHTKKKLTTTSEWSRSFGRKIIKKKRKENSEFRELKFMHLLSGKIHFCFLLFKIFPIIHSTDFVVLVHSAISLRWKNLGEALKHSSTKCSAFSQFRNEEDFFSFAILFCFYFTLIRDEEERTSRSERNSTAEWAHKMAADTYIENLICV